MVRRIWDRGPLAVAGLVLAVAAVAMALGVLAGWRFPVEASRPSRLILALLSFVLLARAGVLFVRNARIQGGGRTPEFEQAGVLTMLSVLCTLTGLALGPQ